MKTGTATIPGLVFFLLVSILSCEPNENRGHGYIPDELYNFLDSISDTIKLYNSKNDCIELVNYKKQLVTQNIIYDADSYDRESGGLFVDEFYYEYDSYYTYFKSDSMHLRIAIKS